MDSISLKDLRREAIAVAAGATHLLVGISYKDFVEAHEDELFETNMFTLNEPGLFDRIGDRLFSMTSSVAVC